MTGYRMILCCWLLGIKIEMVKFFILLRIKYKRGRLEVPVDMSNFILYIFLSIAHLNRSYRLRASLEPEKN